MRYRGLLLDFGGVLTTSVLDAFAAFCEREHIDADLFRRTVMEAVQVPNSVFVQVERGDIEQEEFDARLAAILSEAVGRRIAPENLKQRMFAASTADTVMLDAVKAFRAQGVRTCLVSNSWGGNDYPRESFPELFDGVVISGEVGVRKPDPEIYLRAAQVIGVPPQECVFVDDFAVNVRGAEVVGMHGIHHRDTVETLAKLRVLLEVEPTLDGVPRSGGE